MQLLNRIMGMGPLCSRIVPQSKMEKAFVRVSIITLMEVSTMTQHRRHHTPQEKVVILKRHLLEQTPVSDLCDEFGLSPTLFYRWQKEFFENAHRAFNTDRSTKARQQAQDHLITRLQDKLQRKNEVLAELMEEHVQLKKLLGEP